jgi:hypothetical protein
MQNAELFNGKVGGTYSYMYPLKNCGEHRCELAINFVSFVIVFLSVKA